MSIRPCIFSDEVAVDFEEAVRLAAEAGAMGLELRNHLYGHRIGEVNAEEVKRIRDTCARYGVQIAVIGSPVGKCSTDDPDEQRAHQRLFRRMVELAHAFDTPLIRGFALWRPDRSRNPDHIRPDPDRYLAQIIDFLEPMVRLAEQEGVRFCLETEGATLVGRCDEAGRVIEALGSPSALGVAWDVNNGLACGEAPFPEGYSRIRGRVYHLHVKPDSRGTLATVGNTALSYEQILHVLRQDGYRGWASIEHWGNPAAMLDGLQQLVPVLKQVNRA